MEKISVGIPFSKPIYFGLHLLKFMLIHKDIIILSKDISFKDMKKGVSGLGVTSLDDRKSSQDSFLFREDVFNNLFIPVNDDGLRGGNGISEVVTEEEDLINNRRKVKVRVPHGLYSKRLIPYCGLVGNADQKGTIVKMSFGEMCDSCFRIQMDPLVIGKTPIKPFKNQSTSIPIPVISLDIFAPLAV